MQLFSSLKERISTILLVLLIFTVLFRLFFELFFFLFFTQPFSVNWHCFVVYFVQKWRRNVRRSRQLRIVGKNWKMQDDDSWKKSLGCRDTKRKANKRSFIAPKEWDKRLFPKIARFYARCKASARSEWRRKIKIYLKHYHPHRTGDQSARCFRLHNSTGGWLSDTEDAGREKKRSSQERRVIT